MIIGTAGHIDHGKTTLVRALTGVDTDRLKEEKARGISIDLGFAYLPLEGEEAGEAQAHGEEAPPPVLGFVDVPGHEKFVHTMLSGASGIDFALLVVAADDGVMPQTREHLAILDLLGIRQGIVALTKADLVDAGRRAAVEAEIAALLAPTALAGAPIHPVSATTGEGIAALRDALAAAARQMGQRAAGGRFRLAVDRSFTLAGAGTVVTGTVLSGTVRVGDRVVVSPSGLAARVRSIRAQDRVAEEGVAGDRCGLNLAGEDISKSAIARGDVVLDPALHAPCDHIDADLTVLAGEKRPIAQWLPVRLHHAAREVGARLVLLGDPIAPGASAKVQLVLEEPIAAAVGDRFVIRDTSAQRTIGGGRFLDLRGPKRKRRTPERLAQLSALAERDSATALAALLAIDPYFTDLTAFARDHTLTAEETEALADRLGIVKLAAGTATLAITASRFADFTGQLLAALQAFHAENPDLPGMARERLRLQLVPRLPAPGFLSALESLGDTVKREGAWVRLAGFEVRLSATDEALWSRIAPLIGGTERFRPPRVRDLASLLGVAEPEIRRLMKLASRTGRADEVAHDHFFLRPVVAEMVEILTRLSGPRMKDEFTAAQFRDEVSNGRKVAIQILDFFDRHGVTLRRGDLRRINPFRLDLFAGSGNDATSSDSPAPSARGREASLVGRPDFKSGRGREPVLGGFDSHSLPPDPRKALGKAK